MNGEANQDSGIEIGHTNKETFCWQEERQRMGEGLVTNVCYMRFFAVN